MRLRAQVRRLCRQSAEVSPRSRRFLATRVLEPPKEDTFRIVADWRNPTGLWVPENAMEKTSGAYSQKYFDQWRNLLGTSLFKGYYRYIGQKYEPRFAKYGYSLHLGIDEEVLR